MTDGRAHNPHVPHVLTVDDEPANLTVLEAALAPLGYRIEPAESAADAMTAMRASKPDLVLLDVMMPGQTGIELCRAIRQDRVLFDVPVVLVTALRAETARSAGLASGADDYVEKPIDIDDLTHRIRSIVGRAHMRDRSPAGPVISSRRDVEGQALEVGIDAVDARRLGLEAMVHEAAVAVGGSDRSDVLAAAMARAAGLPAREGTPR